MYRQWWVVVKCSCAPPQGQAWTSSMLTSSWRPSIKHSIIALVPVSSWSNRSEPQSRESKSLWVFWRAILSDVGCESISCFSVVFNTDGASAVGTRDLPEVALLLEDDSGRHGYRVLHCYLSHLHAGPIRALPRSSHRASRFSSRSSDVSEVLEYSSRFIMVETRGGISGGSMTYSSIACSFYMYV